MTHTAALNPAVGDDAVDYRAIIVKLELGAGRLAALAGAQCAEISTRLWNDVTEELQQQQSTITVYAHQQPVTVKLLLALKVLPHPHSAKRCPLKMAHLST